jgi:ABC-2 type transport system permease protein
MNNLRVFVSSAVFSFRAQFNWLSPSMWLTMKFVLSFSQMAFFVFVGIFSGGGASAVSFIAIGNAMQSLSWNTVFSVVQIIGQDKWDGTLPLVLATPANRLPLFVGRAMVHVLDGLVSVAISFAFAAFVFGVNFAHADPFALAVTVLLTSFTMAGFGLLIGGFSFHFRNPIVFANIFTFILLIFCGVNFPFSALPRLVQPISYAISYAFPLTYGINAARQAINGASLFNISPILAEQIVVGLLSIAMGYLLFESFERSARKTGKMEAQ